MDYIFFLILISRREFLILIKIQSFLKYTSMIKASVILSLRQILSGCIGIFVWKNLILKNWYWEGNRETVDYLRVVRIA